jgi:hypothetical protein
MTLKSSLPLVGATLAIIVVQAMSTYLIIRKEHQIAWQIMESFKICNAHPAAPASAPSVTGNP